MIVGQYFLLSVECFDNNTNKKVKEKDADNEDHYQSIGDENEFIMVFYGSVVNLGCIYGLPHHLRPSFMTLNRA